MDNEFIAAESAIKNQIMPVSFKKHESNDLKDDVPVKNGCRKIDVLMSTIKRLEERTQMLEEHVAALTKSSADTIELLLDIDRKLDDVGLSMSRGRSSESQAISLHNNKYLSGDEGPAVDPSEAWSNRFTQLRRYRIIHGHCQGPGKKGDKKLYYWICDQRKMYRAKRLKAERIDKLNSIGFKWGKDHPIQPSWDTMFELLNKYQQEKGHCEVPFNPSALSKWMMWQRTEYRRLQEGQDSLLTEDQIGKLDEIGMNWKGPRL